MEHKKHEHNHNHTHGVSDITGARLFFVIVLNFIITVAQTAGGLIAGSLSLISDALHNFSDGISIIISYLAIRISQRNHDARRTYGYRRASVLAALINSAFLVVVSVLLFKEAYQRFVHPASIDGILVIWVAIIGLIANALGVALLHNNAKGDMNLRSSYLHLLSDTLSSVAVIIGGVLIHFFNTFWVDPLLTVLIALYVLKHSYGIIKKAFQILMQGTPDNLDINAIVADLEQLDDIDNVHHVHVWSLDERNLHFEAHVNIKDMPVSETAPLLDEIRHRLSHYGIGHVTIQFEYQCCKDVDVINTQ